MKGRPFASLGVLLGLGLGLAAPTMSNQQLSIDFPLMVTISKNQQGSGLLVRSDKNHYTAVYRGGTFSDLSIDFDVVQLDTDISHYQMTISELVHQCNDSIFAVVTYLDSNVIEKGDILTGLGFPFSAQGQKYNRHSALMVFPPISPRSQEQSCHGVFSVSVHEQI